MHGAETFQYRDLLVLQDVLSVEIDNAVLDGFYGQTWRLIKDQVLLQ